MRSNVLNHNPKILKESAKNKHSQAKTLRESFIATLQPNSARGRAITRAISGYIAKDLRPFSSVDNDGFRKLV